MKLAKIIMTWVANLCSTLFLIFALSCTGAEQVANVAGEIKIPPPVPTVDTAQYHYDERILTSKDHLHDVHVAIRITLDDHRMPTTLRVENFDANIKSCEDRELSAEESDTDLELKLRITEFVEYKTSERLTSCQPPYCRGYENGMELCLMDCQGFVKKIHVDKINSYQGRNRAGQLFKFKWRAFVEGEVNKNPLLSFTFTDGSTFTEPEPEPIPMIYPTTWKWEPRMPPFELKDPPYPNPAYLDWKAQRELRKQQRVAAHFCD